MNPALSFESINGSQPVAAIAFLHGILGQGKNLRSLAAGFVRARPDFSAMLVDLRGHGHSQKGAPDPSLQAAALDVVRLATGHSLPVRAIVGHSFGGKVALEAVWTGAIDGLQHAVIIDSPPGRREPVHGGDSALTILDTLQSMPPYFASQSEFVDALSARGQTQSLARWLAGSLERDGEHVRFGLDLGEIRALILDYFEQDLWPVVEQASAATRIHLVIGDRSDAFSKADIERAARIAAANESVTVDILPAGHWVHVDDPEGLLQVLVKRISG